jgi:hypothetical protein
MAFTLSTAARAEAGSVTGIDPGQAGFGPSTLGPEVRILGPKRVPIREEDRKRSFVVRDQSRTTTKMNVHVPETWNHVLSPRVDDRGALWQLGFAEFAYCPNAITDNDDRAVE